MPRPAQTLSWESAEINAALRISLPTSSDGLLNIEKMFKATRELDPEKRLMVAILEESIRSLQLNHLDAREWFAVESSEYIFSFVSICEYLGFDPDWIRRGVQECVKQPNGQIRLTSSRRTRPVKYNKKISRPLRTDIPDVPGHIYTHAYGTCTEWMLIKDCPECMTRYNHWHWLHRRPFRQERSRKANEARWSRVRKEKDNDHN